MTMWRWAVLASLFVRNGQALARIKFTNYTFDPASGDASVGIAVTMDPDPTAWSAVQLLLRSGDIKKAVKHYIIAAAQGQDESIKLLMFAFKEGDVSKDDLAAALRAHQAAVDATKSLQREAAKIAGI